VTVCSICTLYVHIEHTDDREALGTLRRVSRPLPPPTGLCAACRHQQLVPNTRGSVFSLCGRSRTDPAFPRYPRLPVRECPGFEAITERPDDGRGAG
jgi:hypothetical protein